MKLFNNNHSNHENSEEHDHSQQKGWRGIPNKVRQYVRNMFNSDKLKKMSCGSCNIVRAMSWARGENWRRNHPKSLNKNQKK